MTITGTGPLDSSLWLSAPPVTVELRGASMEPLLSEGDRVEVVLAAREELKAGDLVVFRRGEERVVHRFLKGLPGGFLEGGPNRPWPPPRVAAQDLAAPLRLVPARLNPLP
ncbi:MAG: S24/S26 family peptidase [Acidobacteriota bacterium]